MRPPKAKPVRKVSGPYPLGLEYGCKQEAVVSSSSPAEIPSVRSSFGGASVFDGEISANFGCKQEAMASSSSPAEIPSVRSSFGGASVFDGEISANFGCKQEAMASSSSPAEIPSVRSSFGRATVFDEEISAKYGYKQEAMASTSSPAEIPSFPIFSDGGASVFDGEISATVDLREVNKDHRYSKNGAASMSGLVRDEAEMRPVTNNATSGQPRNSLTWSEVRAMAMAKSTVNSLLPIDSRSRTTTSHKTSGDMPSTPRQASNIRAAPKVMIVGIERLYCVHCGTSYEHKVLWENNIVTHSLDKNVCSACGQMLAQPAQAEKAKPYVCPLCLRAFGRKQHLKAHELRMHAVDRPYVCAQCGRDFARLADLNCHERRHAVAEQKRQLAASSSKAQF